MLTLVGMQGVGTSSCYDRKVRSEIHSPAAYHHKSTDCLIKITVHLQLLTTPHQIRAVRSFGEYRPGENEIDVSARQRSQQLWRENPQFRAILAVNFESENDSNKLSGGERGTLPQLPENKGFSDGVPCGFIFNDTMGDI